MFEKTEKSRLKDDSSCWKNSFICFLYRCVVNTDRKSIKTLRINETGEKIE